MAQGNRQVWLDKVPEGRLGPEHFRFVDAEIPTPADGEVLVKSLYLSLDAGTRAWMQGATYRSALGAGEVMAGRAIGEVVSSKDSGFKAGDLVSGDIGWQQYAAVAPTRLTKRPKMDPVTHLLGVYGISGLTAYFGLLDCGDPKPGDTVVVSAAGGAVGSVVAQIAKLKGARVVGIAGGADKCKWLVDELGLDACVDHKAGDLRKQLKDVCPKGIDVYFDNVGGAVFETCLSLMAVHGRMACCGAVAAYDGAAPATGPRGVPGLMVTKRLTMKGFLVMDYESRYQEGLDDLQKWVSEGKIKVLEDIVDGLDNAPQGLIGILAGTNRGKRLVKVS